jgi:hypothetical protein
LLNFRKLVYELAKADKTNQLLTIQIRDQEMRIHRLKKELKASKNSEQLKSKLVQEDLSDNPEDSLNVSSQETQKL